MAAWAGSGVLRAGAHTDSGSQAAGVGRKCVGSRRRGPPGGRCLVRAGGRKAWPSIRRFPGSWLVREAGQTVSASVPRGPRRLVRRRGCGESRSRPDRSALSWGRGHSLPRSLVWISLLLHTSWVAASAYGSRGTWAKNDGPCGKQGCLLPPPGVEMPESQIRSRSDKLAAPAEAHSSGLARRCQSTACWYWCATARMVPSSKGRPTSCMPMGSASCVKPQGTEMAGWPERLNGSVRSR